MIDETVDRAIEDLGSNDAERMKRAVVWLEGRLAALPEPEFRAAVEALAGLFYVDTFDQPQLEDLLDGAQEALVKAGPRAIPGLIQLMKGSDVKSHLYLGRTLGQIGASAIGPLREFVATEEDAYCRAFGLFALGKIADPAVQEALPEIVGNLIHPDREVRDSAARALGKVFEVVPPSALTERRKTELFETLSRGLHDSQPVVRAKTIRSLGKMAAAGYLSAAQAEDVRKAARAIAGEGDKYEWDNAYIVRREAANALRMIGE